MTISTHQILCGTCKCPGETVANAKSHDRVKCPRCGRNDRVDHAQRIAAEYVAHRAAERISSSLAKANRPGSIFKLTMKRPGYRRFRWIVAGV